ncbi:MAG: T9SS type A sorting domain-containing protein [Bacteroidia bacterium]
MCRKASFLIIFLLTVQVVDAQNYYHPTTGQQNTYTGACMVSTCSGNYYDNGGPSGDYSNSINNVYRTFCPNAAGMCLRVTFSQFNVEPANGPNCYDFLQIKAGPTQNSPNLFSGCGTNISIGPFTSNDPSGCLTFRFYSDFTIPRPGWAATLSCVPCTNGPISGSNSDCSFATAICSNSGFTGASSGPGLLSEGCSGCNLSENFSNWYLFQAQTSGTLRLNIDPNVNTDDYDFAIYGPNVICGSLGSPIRCSYAANTGNTGMSPTATDFSEDVFGDGFVAPLNVTAGQTYYLMVNKWSAGGAGFVLDWAGSTASLDCAVLPVELLSFDAQMKRREVEVKWTTATETNNDYFIVEKSSDALNFEAFAQVKGAGNSVSLKNYNTIDKFPFIGYNYYRLKQVDFDGKYEYSKTVAVNNIPSLLFALSPVPATDIITVYYNADVSEVCSIVLIDAQGRIILEKEIYTEEGYNIFNFDISDIAKGVYLMKIENKSGENYSSKMIKI